MDGTHKNTHKNLSLKLSQNKRKCDSEACTVASSILESLLKLENQKSFSDKLEKLESFLDRLENQKSFSDNLEKLESFLDKLEKMESTFEKFEKLESFSDKLEKMESTITGLKKTVEYAELYSPDSLTDKLDLIVKKQELMDVSLSIILDGKAERILPKEDEVITIPPITLDKNFGQKLTNKEIFIVDDGQKSRRESNASTNASNYSALTSYNLDASYNLDTNEFNCGNRRTSNASSTSTYVDNEYYGSQDYRPDVNGMQICQKSMIAGSSLSKQQSHNFKQIVPMYTKAWQPQRSDRRMSPRNGPLNSFGATGTILKSINIYRPREGSNAEYGGTGVSTNVLEAPFQVMIGFRNEDKIDVVRDKIAKVINPRLEEEADERNATPFFYFLFKASKTLTIMDDEHFMASFAQGLRKKNTLFLVGVRWFVVPNNDE